MQGGDASSGDLTVGSGIGDDLDANSDAGTGSGGTSSRRYFWGAVVVSVAIVFAIMVGFIVLLRKKRQVRKGTVLACVYSLRTVVASYSCTQERDLAWV